MKTSEKLAEWIDHFATYGKSKIVFVIGGSLGLSEEVMERADESLSFSKMTFPHQLMRLVLVEEALVYKKG
ncbi:23S rRNA (pseudouridine(1915)-N(3))-methyltransferase RlmH [Bacillus sp. IITD106]|nr:23S rRNA (pseudouridine(1915)-N(3))-methyltransferase RlmH [Bacillus sp. IITD106]